MNNDTDITEPIIDESIIQKATGAEYESLEELREARSKLSLWKKLKLTWQGRTRVGRIAGTVLDLAEIAAPGWAIKTRDLIQSTQPKQNPDDMYWLLNRLTERSTWRGLIVAATGAGVTIAPELQGLIITAGASLFAVVEFFVKEPGSEDA